MHALGTKVIDTARFRLYPLQAHHAEPMFAGLNHLASYAFIPDLPPVSVAALAERYARLERRGPPDGSAVWLNWVIGRADQAGLFGYVQATVLPAEQRALVAYFVFAPHRRQGIARETLQAVIAEILAGFELRRIDAEIDTRNAASIALVESLGFSRTRTVPHADEFKGSVSDEHHYSYTPDLA